jgi:hypothetical protein
MLSPAFTNTSISNAYRGADQVNKILLGRNHVWPLSPEFSFDTYQSGGELNFRVVSDTQYVACTVNDTSVFIYKTNGTTTNNIQAINLNAQAYNKLYQLSQTSNVIDISLPLYERKVVKISGRGTQVTRYNADYNLGIIQVDVFNPYGSDIEYNISLTGKGSITKTCVVGIQTRFSFTSVSKGTRTVTIQNLTDGTSNSTTVYINTNYTPITVQNLELGFNAGAVSTNSNTLTDIKVYSLTESEALNSIYGSDCIISVEQKNDGSETGYRQSANFYRLIFRIVATGSKLPINSRIAMRWGDRSYFTSETTVYSIADVTQHILTLVTDDIGRVIGLEPGVYFQIDPWRYEHGLPQGRSTRDYSEPYFRSSSLERIGHMIDSSNEMWSTVHAPRWKINNSKQLTFKTTIINGIPNTWLRSPEPIQAANVALSFHTNWVRGGAAGITFNNTSDNSIISNKVKLIEHSSSTDLNFAPGIFAPNLLFDNQDLVGNLQSVDLKDINVNSITSTTQRELQIIRSININTSTNKASNSNVKAVNTNEFKSTHGPETTYQYYNGTWPYGFNPLIYRQFYPDTIGAAYSSSDFEGLWYHYKTWGAEQGFTHSADFLAQDYLDLNPDLQVAFGSDPSPRTSAMLHWFEYGIAEGRQGRK